MGEYETKLIRYNDHKVSRLLHRHCSQPDTWARRWEFQQMTDDYKEDLDMNPLQDGDPVEEALELKGGEGEGH